MVDLPAAGPGPTPPRSPPLIILVLVTALGPLAMHAVLPALPEIAAVFGIPDDRIGYIVTAYLAGFAVTQLIVGPLSDRFGRRPVIVIGMSLFLIATAACLFAPNATWLFGARTLQAIGSCAGMVLGRAILRDCYSRDEAASRMGYLVTAMALGTMLAPSVGGVIVLFSGWQGVFIVFTMLGAAAVIASLIFLHETNLAPLERLNIGVTLRNYFLLLRTGAFFGPALNTGCQNAVWFAFVTVMPVAIVAIYGGNVTDYGLWIVAPMSAYVVGSFVAGRISLRVGTEGMIRAGMVITGVGLAAILAVACIENTGPGPLFAAMTIYVFGNGIALPSLTATAISVNPTITGAAAGLLGFVQWTAGVAATAAVSTAGLTDIPFLHGVMLAFAAVAFLTLLTRRAPEPG